MKTDPTSAQQAILRARQALQAGDSHAARSWARAAASFCPDLEEPWLILAALSRPRASQAYLGRALRINPESVRARKGMEWAAERLLKETTPPAAREIAPEKTGQDVEETQPNPRQKPISLEKIEKEPLPIAAPAASRFRPALRVLQYLAGKALTIAGTIIIGVFLTVLLTNRPARIGVGPPGSPFETNLRAQINSIVQITIPGSWDEPPDPAQRQALTDKLSNEMGLNLPYLPRNLLWTIKALTFDWGTVGTWSTGMGPHARNISITDEILKYLPKTLLLMATAYLLVFLLGTPLSLYLARNYGKRADRIFAILAPVSSVPSWVFGILLITIFASQLRLLPFSGMYDASTPTNSLQYILTVSKHMILPVTAIVLSLLFQVVYAWRTFFIIYSEEDYVELAQAKGLPAKMLERKYILRPALPYFITSFATTLIGFWQLCMALEVTFRWPGLGWLYVQSLPNFWGESMAPGQLMITVGIVVIFAYLLGGLALLLDLFYVIVDPRIRLLPKNKDLQARATAKSVTAKWRLQFQGWRRDNDPGIENKVQVSVRRQRTSWVQQARNLRLSGLELWSRSRLFFQELRRYPSAIFGLTMIVILLAGSVYAVTALPFEQVGKDYEQKRLAGRSYIPQTAMPIWFNLFNRPRWLSTLILDQKSPQTQTAIQAGENGWTQKTITFTFDYPYKATPSEVFLYFDPKYDQQPPFVTLQWKTPDGRIINLKRTIAGRDSSYDFQTGVPIPQLFNQNPAWKNWFDMASQYRKPAFNMLFAQPAAAQLAPQRGMYQLTLTSQIFEPNGDLQAQLVLLGQAYGPVGTDYARRDLLVPLFWGMPFALFIGLLGSLITTLVAMLLPAIGVWYGGWVDTLVQRISEVNMVLPGLAIAVLANALFNWNIWIILGIVVVINAFGSPLKIVRSALLQAKEAPYIESALAYGASNSRMITHYLLPRIMPVLIPQLISQVPSFIFWEATLGFFNIQSVYPTWGRIIYDGLARGALYGSPFWVLEPIFLLLLTGLAFAMLGSALERILNPRILNSPLQTETADL